MVRFSVDGAELGRLLSRLPGKRWTAGGAKRSESEPVKSRAMVEVSAMVVTCVDGRPAGGAALGGFEMGVNVWTMVPS